jgi:uncharacterized protein
LRYLDSSAIVKLILEEPGSHEMRHYINDPTPVVSSALAATEVMRTVGPVSREAVTKAAELLRTFELITIDDLILGRAGRLLPWSLRSLDAIHVATAATMGAALSALVTYDRRMAEAARALGMTVESPGVSG